MNPSVFTKIQTKIQTVLLRLHPICKYQSAHAHQFKFEQSRGPARRNYTSATNNSLSDLVEGHAQDEDQHLQDIKSQMEAALGPMF
jgi:hypothetical protein